MQGKTLESARTGMEVEEARVNLQGQKPKAMGKDFILHNRCIILNIYSFYREGEEALNFYHRKVGWIPMAMVGTSAIIIRRSAFAIGGSMPMTSTTISESFMERTFWKTVRKEWEVRSRGTHHLELSLKLVEVEAIVDTKVTIETMIIRRICLFINKISRYNRETKVRQAWGKDKVACTMRTRSSNWGRKG